MTPIPRNRPGRSQRVRWLRRSQHLAQLVGGQQHATNRLRRQHRRGGGKGQRARPTCGGRVPIEWNRYHGPSAFTVTPIQSFETLVSRLFHDNVGGPSWRPSVMASPQPSVPLRAQLGPLRIAPRGPLDSRPEPAYAPPCDTWPAGRGATRTARRRSAFRSVRCSTRCGT